MSGKCAKCNLPIENVQTTRNCSDCAGIYHEDCCGRMKALRSGKKWCCESCRGEKESVQSRSDTETTRPAQETSVLSMLQAMRHDMAENMKQSLDRFDGLESSIGGVIRSIEEFQGRISVLETENSLLKVRCEKNEDKISELTKKISSLHCEFQDMQQYSRRNNIEIKGVPYQSKENIYVILEHVARALNVPYHREDFSIAHRVPNGNKESTKNIIAAFISRYTRGVWLAAARKKRLTTADLSPHLEPGNVYINPHLTGFNKMLLGKAKSLVKSGQLYDAWTNEGKVMIRQTERGPACRILTLEDLVRFSTNGTTPDKHTS